MVIMNNIILYILYHGLLYVVIIYHWNEDLIRNMILKQRKSSSVVAGSRTEKHSQPQSQTCRFASSAPKQSTCHSPGELENWIITFLVQPWFNHGCWPKKGASINGGTPKNEWFLMENPMKLMFWRYPYFRKPPYQSYIIKSCHKSHISYIWNHQAMGVELPVTMPFSTWKRDPAPPRVSTWRAHS